MSWPGHIATNSIPTDPSSPSTCYSISSPDVEQLWQNLTWSTDTLSSDFDSDALSSSTFQDPRSVARVAEIIGDSDSFPDQHVFLSSISQPALPSNDFVVGFNPDTGVLDQQQLLAPSPSHNTIVASSHGLFIPTTGATFRQVHCPLEIELDPSCSGSSFNRSSRYVVQDTPANITDRTVASAPRAGLNPNLRISPLETNRPRRFRCQHPCKESPRLVCGKHFRREKDLRRHKGSVHFEKGDRKYQCRCGKGGPRKDNHRRHVKTCKSLSECHYTCKCGHQALKGQDYLQHVEQCRGAPPASSLK